MRSAFPSLLLVGISLAACSSPRPSASVSVADAIGTPFYIVLKIPVCAATLAVAGPAAALQALAEPSPLQGDIRPALDRGIAENCGPPALVPVDAIASDPPS